MKELIKDIKDVCSSNEFKNKDIQLEQLITDFLKVDRNKQLTLTDVSQQSELLIAVICEYNKINTYKEIKKVEEWLEKWDSK